MRVSKTTVGPMPGLATAVLRSHVRFAFQEVEVGVEAGDAPARHLHQDEEHLDDQNLGCPLSRKHV